ncbi:hypothetical protein [Salipiger abyssi]|uniref:hypothetical protein n=1 Tax=Salipiger abyssi TaxID=1250539 RepID=UPI004057CFD2
MGENPDADALLERLRRASKEISFPISYKTALEALFADLKVGPEARALVDNIHTVVQVLLELAGGSASISAQDTPEKGDLPTVKTAAVPTETPAVKSLESSHDRSGRRAPSDGFDYCLYRGVNEKRKGRPVSQKALYQLLSAFDPSTKDGSLISKTNRLKKSGYLAWQRPKDLQITDLGKEEMERLRAHLSDEDIANIKRAFREAWDGMEIEIEIR